MKPTKTIYLLQIITLLSFLFLQTGFAQEKTSKLDLEKDLTILKRNLEDIHGGLYTYSSKQEIDDWFAKTRLKLKDSMDRFEFYKHIAPLNSIIKNGHTNISYPRLGKKFKLLPIQLYKYKDSFYISKSFSVLHKHLEGVQILEIDDVAINQIFNTLLKTHKRDGNNLTFPSENLSSLFGLDYALIYGSKNDYTLTVIKENKTFKITLESSLINDHVRKFYRNSDKLKALNFKINDSIGVLTFPTFSTNELKKENYKSLLEDSFQKIKSQNIKHLIIDVRNNGGGDPVPTQELISYLIDKEFVMYKDVYTITNKIADKKYYEKQGLFWLNMFSWLKVKKVEDNYYRIRNKEGMDVFSPKENNFKGKLYILANGNSFSATGEFTSFIKNNRDVLFIGEEVGGNAFQNTSGVDYTITLPNSKQRVKLPLVVWEMNISSGNNSHGIKPDYWIKNTIEDEMRGNDSVLNFTYSLIKKLITNNVSQKK